MPTKCQTRYPWDSWLKRRHTYTLKRGTHFDCLPHGMAQQVRNAAAARKVRVSIQIIDDTLIVCNLGAA